MTEWREQTLSEFMHFNPRTPLLKGSIAKKVAMEHLASFNRKIQGYEEDIFKGGAKFKNGDTLVARITPCLENGKTAYVDFLVDKEVAFGSTEFIVLRAKEGISDSKFIFYLAISDEFRDTAIQLMSGSSGRQRVETEALKQKVFSLPPLPEQKAIAEVLSSLDDKIDLLTRQNKTLEDLAQTYFRKWFVEDASEDWDVVPISSKYNILLGGTPSRKIESYWKNGTVGWINSGKVNDFRILEASEFITEEALQKSAAKLLPAGTTVIAITGATLGQISIIEYSFAANQSVIGLVPKAELSNNFIYLWLKENLDALVSRQTGGAQQHINSDDVKSFEVVVPNSKMVNLFSIVIDPMMEKISRNCFQILILQKLRDTLLPKLISGEVRVKQ